MRWACIGEEERLEEGELGWEPGRGSSTGKGILRRYLGSGGTRTGLLLLVLAGISGRRTKLESLPKKEVGKELGGLRSARREKRWRSGDGREKLLDDQLDGQR